MIEYDFHTHTTYSHGKGTVMENAISAKEKGLKGIAITDHGFNHPAFGMRRRELDNMRRDCTEAEQKTGVKVWLGIEANLLGISGKTDVRESDYEKLDLYIAGVHKFVRYDKIGDYIRLFGKNWFFKAFKKEPSQKLIDYNTKVYINAIKNNPIDIISHLDYCCFCDTLEVAKCMEDYGTYLEINTKKVHMTDEQWQNIVDKTNVKFVIDSDAHSVDRIGDEKLALELMQRVNIPRERIYNIEGRMPEFRFKAYKEKHL